MADDITDVYIATEVGNAGWQSLSALAAAQVDAKLPISDEADTVTLDGADSVFTVKTDDVERLKIDSFGRVLTAGSSGANVWNRFAQVANSAGGDLWAFYVDVKAPANSKDIRVYTSDPQIDDAATVSRLTHFTPYYTTGGGTFVATVAEQNALLIDDATFQAGAKNNVIKTTLASVEGKENFVINAQGTAPSEFHGEIRVDRIVGTSFSTDASIELGTNFTATAGAGKYQLLNSGFHLFDTAGPQSRFTSDGRFLVGTQTPDTGYSTTIANRRGDEVGVIRYVTTHGSDSCSLYVDCVPAENTARLKSPNNLELVVTGSSMNLGTDFVVSVGSEPTVTVSPRFMVQAYRQNDGTFDASGTTCVGVYSVNAVSGTNVTRASAFEGLVNIDGSFKELSIYNARNGNVSDGSTLTGVYAGFRCNNLAVLGDEQAAFYSDVDLSGVGENDVARHQFYAAGNAPSFFGPEIQVDRIVGATAPDTDASIDLGAGATITTSYQELLVSGYAADYSGGTVCGLGDSSNYIWSKADNGLAICADRIAFNSNMAGGATACNWSMETDGTLVGANGAVIEANSISAGRNNAGDASIELGTNFKLKTNSNIEGYVNGTREFQILSGRVVAERQFVGGGAGGLTAANPAYAFAGALDTGFFGKTVSGKTAFGVSTNAVERLLITDTDIKAADDYEPKNPQSLATVQYVLDNAASEASTRADADTELQQNIDAKIWVGTTQEYLNLREILPTTLYCLTD